MLISPLLHQLVIGALVAIAVITLLVLLGRPDRGQPDDGTLPVARVRVPVWRRLLRYAPYALVLAAGLGACGLYGAGTDVVRVYDTPSGVAAERRIYLGDPPYRTVDDPYRSSDPTWVVNESSRPVRIETVQYGRTLGWGSRPDVVPPGMAAVVLHVDHLGPDDRPPPEIAVDQVSAKIGMSFREWVTWDP